MKNREKIGFWIYATGAIIVLLATVAFINGGAYTFSFEATPMELYCKLLAPWAFSVGVVLNIVGRVMTLPPLKNFRVRRLNNILALSAILLMASAYFMFIGRSYCIITILLSALFDLWYTYRIKGALDEEK